MKRKRTDTDRLDWLERQGERRAAWFEGDPVPPDNNLTAYSVTVYDADGHADLRAAIDAAMDAEEGGA